MKKTPIALMLLFSCDHYCLASVPAVEISDAEAKQFYLQFAPPKTVPQLLKAISLIAQSGVYSRSDFYSAENLKKLFGYQLDAKVRDDGVVTVATIHGYKELVSDSNKLTNSMPYMAGVWIEARKPDANGWLWCCTLNVKFYGYISGLDFKNVTQVFGANWTEDTYSERMREFSRAEPFNTPSSPPTGFMGDSIIVYQTGKICLVLGFDLAGDLQVIRADWPNAAQPIQVCPTARIAPTGVDDGKVLLVGADTSTMKVQFRTLDDGPMLWITPGVLSSTLSVEPGHHRLHVSCRFTTYGSILITAGSAEIDVKKSHAYDVTATLNQSNTVAQCDLRITIRG